mmetsp:Transcript_23853/g.37313  ORF Transcript_23853/g.37313 Transcript_23853/m.37313 type:complete len:161 (-) Transcript_23853:230-712(-)
MLDHFDLTSRSQALGGIICSARNYTSCFLHTELQTVSMLAPQPRRLSANQHLQVTGVKGHAIITYRQGKKRAGVNWDEVTIGWQDEKSGAAGKVRMKEFFSEFPEDIEIEVTVSSEGNGSTGGKEQLRSQVMALHQDFSLLPGKLVEALMGIKSQVQQTS